MADRSEVNLEETTRNAIFDGAYEIVEPIGRGRHSVVYHAHRLPGEKLNICQDVALKVLTGSSKKPEFNRARMKREAVAMLSTRHKNVIQLYDFVSTGELYYLSMEFAARGDLSFQLAERGKPFTAVEALSLIAQVLSGLEVVHRAGIVHRDIKPENLLITEDGDVKITDFGIASIPSEELPIEETERGVGTFEYLAPELLEAGISNATTDLYSTGVTLYNLLTCKNPYEGQSLTQSLDKKLKDIRPFIVKLVPGTSPEVEKLLQKSLAPKPEDRFKSASEFRKAVVKTLKTISAGQNETTRKKALVENLARIADEQSAQESPSNIYLPAVIEQEPVYYEHIETAVSPARKLIRSIISSKTIKSLAKCGFLGLLFFGFYSLTNTWLSQSSEQTLAKDSPQPIPSTILADKKKVQPKTTGVFKSLSSSPQAGFIENFFSESEHLSFSLEPLSGEQSNWNSEALEKDPQPQQDPLELAALLRFGLPGTPSTNIKLGDLIQGKEVAILLNGLSLALVMDSSSMHPDSKQLSGVYKDSVSGRTGRWLIFN